MKKYLIAFCAVVVVALMLVSIADGKKPLTDVQAVSVQKIITLFSTEYRRITKSFLLMVASCRSGTK